MSHDESRSEDKTEFHGIEEKRVLIAFISALLYSQMQWQEGL